MEDGFKIESDMFEIIKGLNHQEFVSIQSKRDDDPTLSLHEAISSEKKQPINVPDKETSLILQYYAKKYHELV